MATSSDITDELAAQALKPAAVDTSVVKVTNRPLADLIAAQKHLANNEAVGENEFFGIRCRKARFNQKESN